MSIASPTLRSSSSTLPWPSCRSWATERLARPKTAEAIGYPGQILARAEPSLPPAAFVLDWGDGSAAFDPAGAAVRVAEALEGALAAEGLHAEALPSPINPADEA